MRADDWIVDYLIKKGVTDTFGIPGVVIMDFLYAMDRRKPDMTPHLNYHEQGSSFAACGYAQTTGKLGVTYSTRGPGFTNMITAMADAYYDSVPVMFITAHESKEIEPNIRIMNNQEMDTVALARNITKKSCRIDSIDELQTEVVRAYHEATTGRKGPVFLDFWNALFAYEVDDYCDEDHVLMEMKKSHNPNDEDLIRLIRQEICRSRRPIMLIGNGVRNAGCKEQLKNISERFNIPILSSRSGQDIIPDISHYFGFIGSRGTRYSNFILSKTDLIIAIGNRLSFPRNSKSFLPIVKNTKVIRIDVDACEFERQIPNCINVSMDSLDALQAINKADLYYDGSDEWIRICRYLRDKLDRYDNNNVVNNLMKIIGASGSEAIFTCDVGNHSFWVATAYAYQKAENRIMYSASFGTLGSALPKAIGAYYATGKTVICFAGDQGIQFNIQELMYISKHKIPLIIVIMNNSSSGMIMEREREKYNDYLVHTTIDSGYDSPNFRMLSKCYGIDYIRIKEGESFDYVVDTKPCIIEMMIDRNETLEPKLPVGSECQNLFPKLPKELYCELNAL